MISRGASRGASRRRELGAAAALLLGAACAHRPAAAPPPREVEREPPRREAPSRAAPPGAETGFASFYGGKFHGRRTASGARYDERKLTCAHPSAPFGTRLRVTDLETGRSVIVIVNDRGPFAEGRVVDLSLAAARKLGMVDRGLTRVRVERIDDVD